MIQDLTLIQQRYRKFIEKVCETQIVYGLQNNAGFATSMSNDFQDEDTGEDMTLICFWSEEVLARVLAKKEWSSYKPESIALNSFLENWCVGMYYDGTIAGINFDQNLFGFEIDTLDLALDIIRELKRCNTEIELLKFESLDDLESQIKQL